MSPKSSAPCLTVVQQRANDSKEADLRLRMEQVRARKASTMTINGPQRPQIDMSVARLSHWAITPSYLIGLLHVQTREVLISRGSRYHTANRLVHSFMNA